MIVSLIWAMARNGVIGRDGALPWRLPDEMAWFREHTLGKPVIMGRLTCEGLRGPLKDRTNLVLTRRTDLPAGFEAAASLADALRRAEAIALATGQQEVMVIGGARVYAEALARADRLYRTLIDADVDGDVRFPTFDADAWRTVREVRHERDDRHAHPFTLSILERG